MTVQLLIRDQMVCSMSMLRVVLAPYPSKMVSWQSRCGWMLVSIGNYMPRNDLHFVVSMNFAFGYLLGYLSNKGTYMFIGIPFEHAVEWCQAQCFQSFR